jgi:hypothetical protein
MQERSSCQFLRSWPPPPSAHIWTPCIGMQADNLSDYSCRLQLKQG